jgi:hypothetical protein
MGMTLQLFPLNARIAELKIRTSVSVTNRTSHGLLLIARQYRDFRKKPMREVLQRLRSSILARF